MENKHIQNNRNENNKKNDTTKKIGKIHIQENEYIKNVNNWGEIYRYLMMEENLIDKE